MAISLSILFHAVKSPATTKVTWWLLAHFDGLLKMVCSGEETVRFCEKKIREFELECVARGVKLKV